MASLLQGMRDMVVSRVMLGPSPAWVDNVEMSCWEGTRGAEWMWWLRTRAQVKDTRGRK